MMDQTEGPPMTLDEGLTVAGGFGKFKLTIMLAIGLF
jgi:hypothetical protein